MSKPMKWMLISVSVLFGIIFAWKGIQSLMIKRYLNTHLSPTVTVSAMKIGYSEWTQTLTGTGSVRAIKGVNVTTSLAGLVQRIYFKPGSMVEEGTLLVQLNADAEIGQLESLKANAELARITLERDKQQFKVNAVSRQTIDTDEQNLKSLIGQVAEQTATVAKKSIRAPFTGKLGINNVSPGQYVNTGDSIVTLQSLDPIYVDFYLPQQALSELRVGQVVQVTTDTYPGKIYKGMITTINPLVDSATRNMIVEATLPNPHHQLTPGMFTYVTVTVGNPKKYLTVPQTAISFNPYGDIIYIVKETKNDKKETELTVKQTFVTTGERRGDQIVITQGLVAGDTIVTSGQLKLRNGSRIKINNSVTPENNPSPKVVNERQG